MEISVKIIADSISSVNGKRLTTFEIQYPRVIHSELMTHRMLSKNCASSRAIPVQKVIDMVRENPATPIYWGKNQPGMQAKEELTGVALYEVEEMWEEAALEAVRYAEMMSEEGAHKQIVNRILEPFQWMKTVITGTEWENFFYLRNHEAAQPEIAHLAKLMEEEYRDNVPTTLNPGDWHLPYYHEGYWKFEGWNTDNKPCSYWGESLEDAIAISVSCCAQTSYRTTDDSLEKAQKVLNRLNLDGKSDDPAHASPAEHQGTPIDVEAAENLARECDGWMDGVTSYHKELGFMSGNLAGFIQYRQLIKGHTKWH